MIKIDRPKGESKFHVLVDGVHLAYFVPDYGRRGYGLRDLGGTPIRNDRGNYHAYVQAEMLGVATRAAEAGNILSLEQIGERRVSLAKDRKKREENERLSHIRAMKQYAAEELYDACKAALGAFENNNAINWDNIARAISKADGR